MARTVSGLGAIFIARGGITQRQVDSIRDKIVELARAFNEISGLESSGTKLMAGERPGLRAGLFQGLGAHTFAAANTSEEVTHNLGRVPIGRLVLSQDAAGSIYDSDRANWNTKTAFLKSDASGLTATVLFF